MALKQFKMKRKTRNTSTKRIGLLCQKISFFFCYIILPKQIDIQSNLYFVITKRSKRGNDDIYASKSEFYSWHDVWFEQ
jgi:hypothetical protein